MAHIDNQPNQVAQDSSPSSADAISQAPAGSLKQEAVCRSESAASIAADAADTVLSNLISSALGGADLQAEPQPKMAVQSPTACW